MNPASRFTYQILVLYTLLWLLFLTQARADIWLAIAIPVSATYCGLMARTMRLHGRVGSSADIPALPAAALVMLLSCGVLVMTGWITLDLEFGIAAISRFVCAWMLSHAILLLIASIAGRLR